MTEIPFHHHDADGSTYEVDVILDRRDPDDLHYDVDLVRASVNPHGLPVEQRLTLAEHPDLDAAQQERDAVEDTIARDGLDGLGDARERIAAAPYLHNGAYLTAAYPPDAEGSDPAVGHLLAVTETGIEVARINEGERDGVEATLETVNRAFADEGVDYGLAAASREAEANGVKPPAAPLFDLDDGAVRHIDGGGTAHWFAITERDDADPYELRYFRALETGDGTELADSYPVMPLPDDDPGSAWPLPGLEMYLEKGDVFMAQQFAHDVADSYGETFPEPWALPALDPRPEYYFGYGVGPNNDPSLEAVKTWMDGGERRFDTLTVGEYGSFEEAAVDERELETLADEGGLTAAMHEAEALAEIRGYLDPNRTDGRIFFEDDAPPDPFTTERQAELTWFDVGPERKINPDAPQYTVGAVSANGASFLDVMKTWGEDDYERLVIPQPDWESARTEAALVNDLLDGGSVQDAMRLVEDAGVQAGVIDPNRDDPRLFTEGPPDPFATVREAELDEDLARYGVTWRESQTWESAEPDVASLHWAFAALPVNDPDGAPLGHALHVVVYDDVPHNAEVPDDAAFRLLEVAHFETPDAAQQFQTEFEGYLMPGVMDAPDLAEAAAQLEGMPGDWQTLDGPALDDFRANRLTLTRDPADWQPYNPNAERDARIEAEGLYTDPIHKLTTFDEDDISISSPDFDF